jgi:protein-disulfide isomerase
VVLKLSMPLRSLSFLLAVAVLGCHAQAPSAPSSTTTQVEPGVKLSPAEARRVEVMIRSRSQVPLEAEINVGVPSKSDIPGYTSVDVTFSADGNTSRPITFLLSTDGKTLAQFNKFDISKDPKTIVSDADRPARGGPQSAPVVIVGFDDLECPFCARMNAELFPAILQRYKDQVRIVYRDFPLDQHPWAMHAAIDANCLGTVSTPAYWNFVDYVHAHADDMAGTEKTAAKADTNLDKLALDEGTKQNLNQKDLAACIEKQDQSKVKASIMEAETQPLSVDSTPALFINGEKVEGVVPIETIYHIIDQALVAAGQTPPPPVPAAKTATPAAKPGR